MKKALALVLLLAQPAFSQGFPFPKTPTRTPTRTPAAPAPTATPAPVATATPSPPPPTPSPTAPPAGYDNTADLMSCVRAPISRRLGPSARVEVITSDGRWEIVPDPLGADRCWLAVGRGGRSVSVSSSFKIRWTLGDAYEEVEAGVVVPIRATRSYYPASSTVRPQPLTQPALVQSR